MYRAFAAEYNWKADPAFVFYLAVYEERWGREPGSLMGAKCEAEFDAGVPRLPCRGAGARAEPVPRSARTSTRSSSTSCRSSRGTRCSEGRARADRGRPVRVRVRRAVAGRLGRRPHARRPRAARRSAGPTDEGWIAKETADRMTDGEASDRRVATLPGIDDTDATRVPEVMAAYYRQQAERYFLQPPPQLRTRRSDHADHASRSGSPATRRATSTGSRRCFSAASCSGPRCR